LGLDIVRDVLPNIGPDWGFCISAPPSSDKTLVPVMIAALRVRSGGPAKRVDQALLTGLNSLAFALVVSYNQSHTDAMKLSTELQYKVDMKYLSNDKLFPAGCRPAFAFKDGYLVLASSPEAVKEFRSTKNGPETSAAETPLLRCSVKALRNYLKDHLDGLAV